MQTVLECRNISKSYGDHVALHDVSLTFKKQGFYGLLGRNGAGKTTLLNIIHAELLATSGEALYKGEPIYENSTALSEICFIKETHNFKCSISVKEALMMAEGFYPGWNQEMAETYLEQFGVSLNKKVKALSKGMSSSLGVTIGLASHAPITIFDEPYIGMDAAARHNFYDLLLEAYSSGERTFILSTHLIDEVSRLFEQVIIIDQGKVMLADSAEDLLNKAYYLTGTIEQLQPWRDRWKIIFNERFGTTETIAVFGEVSSQNKKEILEAGIKIDAIPLQKLMVYLTGKQG